MSKHLSRLMNLPNKIAFSTLILVCIGFVPLVYLTIVKLEQDLTGLLMNQQQASVNYVANDLEQKIHLRTQALQDVADALPLDKLHDREAVSSYLQKRLAIYRLFSNGVVVIGANGMGIADYPRVEKRATADYQSLEYFQDVLATGKPAIGKPRIGRFTKQPGVGVAVPIKNERGEIKGVMAGFIGLTDRAVFDQTHASLGRSGEYVLISVRERMVVTDTDNSDNLNELGPAGFNPMLDRLLSGAEQSGMLTDFHHANSLAVTQHILDGKWLLVGLLPSEEAYAPIRKLKSEIYLAAAVILLLVICLVAWMIHAQLRPLTRATRIMTGMVRDGTPLRSLPVASNDEVGQLLQTFNILQQELQASHQEVFEQKEFLRLIFENQPECVKVVSSSGELVDMNAAGLRMLEVADLKEAKQYGLLNFIHPEYREAFAAFNRKVFQGQPGVFEFPLIGKEGTPLWLETHATPMRDAHGSITGLVGITRDVTERRVIQQELEQQAQNDYLTGLPNRRRFMEVAEQELARAVRYQKKLSIFMVDIDFFKKINDTYGHKSGDAVLQRISAMMRESMREIDVVGRLGGEEFAILLPETSAVEAEEVAERLRACIDEQPVVLESGMPLHVTVSIGVTSLKQKSANIDMLLSVADEALYEAKRTGRNRVCIA